MTSNRNMITPEYRADLMKLKKDQIIDLLNEKLYEIEVVRDSKVDVQSDVIAAEKAYDSIKISHAILKQSIQIVQNTASGYLEILRPMQSRCGCNPEKVSQEFRMISHIKELLTSSESNKTPWE